MLSTLTQAQNHLGAFTGVDGNVFVKASFGTILGGIDDIGFVVNQVAMKGIFSKR